MYESNCTTVCIKGRTLRRFQDLSVLIMELIAIKWSVFPDTVTLRLEGEGEVASYDQAVDQGVGLHFYPTKYFYSYRW